MVRNSNSVDTHVGERLRLRRKLMGISQSELAERLGLTFQQIQKYEKGANRISAGRLYRLAEPLSVPPSYFFDGMKSEIALPPNTAISPRGFDSIPDDVMNSAETLALVRGYYALHSSLLRRRIFDLIQVIGRQGSRGDAA